MYTWSHATASSVSTSNKCKALSSFLRNISLTIDNKFHKPSGSRPRNGRNRFVHSVVAGGADCDKVLTSL